jgi:fructokinase
VRTKGLWGGVEAGGTKFVCMIGRGPRDIHAEARIPTTSPRETILRAAAFFMQHSSETPLEAIGVGSFGPVDLDLSSSTYGYITSTPKPGWAQTNIVGMLRDALGIPVAFDTDVNCAAYGEYRWGAGQGMDSVIYITVGTGIGGGVVFNGKPVH